MSQILGDVDAPGGSSMKPGDQSRKEVTRRTSLLSNKIAKLGTWNVRTMFETGKVFQVARERQAYNIDILGLAETRWNQEGQKRLSTGELLLYSGHPDENARHEEGVALMLSRKTERALITWKGHGSRIITASFTTKNRKINLNIIQCYAPTNDKEDETKNQFYNQLQTIVEKFPAKDISILMGDLNAKIGNDNTGCEEIMGCHGLGEENDNGERLKDLS